MWGLSRKLVWLVALLGVVAQNVWATFHIQKASLTLDMPSNLQQEFETDMADFGLPKYGGRITGRLLYPADEYSLVPHVCQTPAFGIPNCEYGCTDFLQSVPPYTVETALPARDTRDNVIMIIDRGPKDIANAESCTFINKVYHAQLAGASGVVIVSHDESHTTMETPPGNDAAAMQMEEALTIPAVMLKNSDGKKIKEAMAKRADGTLPSVIVTLHFENIIQERQVVEFEAWSDSGDACGSHCDAEKKLLKEMQVFLENLVDDQRVQFKPMYIIWTCPYDYIMEDDCTSQCILHGRYCVPDPEDDTKAGFNGWEVVTENLREACLVEVEKQHPDHKHLWLRYKNKFGDMCSMVAKDGKPANFSRQCSIEVFHELTQFDNDAYDTWASCWSPAEIQDGDGFKPNYADIPIPIFEAMIDSQLGSENVGHVTINPTFRINTEQYRGSITSMPLMRAICAAFTDGDEPDICHNLGSQECLPGNEGYLECMSSANVAKGKTVCHDTFMGFECVCGPGWAIDAVNQDMCDDINECLSIDVGSLNANCNGPRAACHNTQGSYFCERDLTDECATVDAGGCWQGKDDDGKKVHACMDNLEAYQQATAHGLEPPRLSYCKCPPCWHEPKDQPGHCVKTCDTKYCSESTQSCDVEHVVAAAKKATISTGAIVGIVMAGAAVMLAVMGALEYRRRKSVDSQVRLVMSQYLPLEDFPEEDSFSNGGPHNGPSSPAGRMRNMFRLPSRGDGAAGRGAAAFPPATAAANSPMVGQDVPGDATDTAEIYVSPEVVRDNLEEGRTDPLSADGADDEGKASDRTPIATNAPSSGPPL